jgi:hypothetical protein
MLLLLLKREARRVKTRLGAENEVIETGLFASRSSENPALIQGHPEKFVRNVEWLAIVRFDDAVNLNVITTKSVKKMTSIIDPLI